MNHKGSQSASNVGSPRKQSPIVGGGDHANNNKAPPSPSNPTHHHVDDVPPASATPSISQHINAMQQLDQQYDNLRSMESHVEKSLHQLQQEEASLRLALEQSTTTLKEQREKETKKKDEEAVARLEEALMMNDDDSDSDDDSGFLASSLV